MSLSTPLVLHHLRGRVFMVGQVLSALCLTIVIATFLAGERPLSDVTAPGHPPRPRQAAVRLHHALGLPAPLPVPDHLVGQHRRGDALLPAPHCRGLAGSWPSCSCSSTSCCPSCSCSPRPEAQPAQPRRIAGPGPGRAAPRRPLLARRSRSAGHHGHEAVHRPRPATGCDVAAPLGLGGVWLWSFFARELQGRPTPAPGRARGHGARRARPASGGGA